MLPPKNAVETKLHDSEARLEKVVLSGRTPQEPWATI